MVAMTYEQYARAVSTPQGRKAVATLEDLDPEFKDLVLDFKVLAAEARAKESEAAFSEIAQRSYTLGGVEMPFHFVVLIAQSKMVQISESNSDYDTREVYPKTYEVTNEAWNIMRLVKAELEAKGVEFNLRKSSKDSVQGPLREFVEWCLSH